jgi:hypothetical protein
MRTTLRGTSKSFAKTTVALSLLAQKVGDMGVCLMTAVALCVVG